jgi:hypothetical protein
LISLAPPARVEGVPLLLGDISLATANIALALLRAMFNRTIDWELFTGNSPTANIPKYPDNEANIKFKPVKT